MHDLVHKFLPLLKAEVLLFLSSSSKQVLECLYSMYGKRCSTFLLKLLMASHCPYILDLNFSVPCNRLLLRDVDVFCPSCCFGYPLPAPV